MPAKDPYRLLGVSRGAEDLARFARLLGIPLDRVSRSAGEHVQGSVSFGSGASSAQDEKPPVADKPPVPPKTAKPGEFS